ncbi:hypothetical protein MKX07_007122 [Trichoderma sp. CBMAI-0711]|uniref:HNH domain-containing protein n=1 Tax=Trichoderma parareesei TaxID=858221 RepID=A0A2H2ZEE3_TRIPA|nr:hypothetical protein MKX07_007122 [Trichoderma sp. CBMAI-0711]OTA05453.1 hypothetical protein A9Z42_0061310 [Trichoderma parareesei]
MSDEAKQTESLNYPLFRDCLSATILQPPPAPEPKRRRRAKAGRAPSPSSSPSSSSPVPASASAPDPDSDPHQDAEELADFIDYLANGIFQNLPNELQELDYRSWRDSEALQAQYSLPLTHDSLSQLDLPPSICETLVTYNLIAADPTASSHLPSTPAAFLVPILTGYLTTLIEPPPATASTRTDACELCDRSWIPLSYHHLIPRFVHDKAVKRGWHRKEDLQNVAWLCGACHRFVHRFRNHEDLARYYYTVELLLEEEEVRKFAEWVGKLRWKGGNTRSRKN